MEERLNRLEREVGLLKNREKEVYLISECGSYSRTYDNIGIFVNINDAYSEAKDVFGYLDFSMEDLIDLEVGKELLSGDVGTVKIEKFLLQ